MLLANLDLLEPTFRRSVIYIVEHNDSGTLGVVINRPSETAVYNVLPQWADLATKPKTMFIGGLQRAAPASLLLFAPHANSYRRFVLNAFVPLNDCWGYNNRTVAMRFGASSASSSPGSPHTSV